MDKLKQKNDEIPVQIYKSSTWSQLGTWLFILAILGFFAILLSVGREIGWGVLIFIPFNAFMLWVLLLSTQRHLAIYENGIEFRFGSSSRFSRWEDLQRFDFRSLGKAGDIGIYSSCVEKHHEGNPFERFVFGSGYNDFIPLSIVRVPIRWDGCWTGLVIDTASFAKTPIGQYLLYYAPHLFEDEKEKAKNS